MDGGRTVLVMAGSLVLAAALASGCGADEPQDPDTYTSDGGVQITVEAPRSDATLDSPLEVRGRAPGSWSFEADFPVEILDADRQKVADGYATMQGEWMTEEDVDFAGSIEFDRPRTDAGFVVLRRANPSDLPENDDAVEIPVRFGADPSGAY